MYIRIEFKDIENDKTKETQQLFLGSPNGTCLSSLNAHMICPREIRDVVGTVGISVLFWYLDVHILNKHYGGVIHCLNELLKYTGVGRVDILPIEGQYDNEKFDDLITMLMKYIDVSDYKLIENY